MKSRGGGLKSRGGGRFGRGGVDMSPTWTWIERKTNVHGDISMMFDSAVARAPCYCVLFCSLLFSFIVAQTNEKSQYSRAMPGISHVAKKEWCAFFHIHNISS